ncbi:MAG: hypothetical protein V2I33_19755 [Kangiellaceae bacterium]|jgi:hypothetical protein|nr:hypothetical protein [Kangiellaceae bacterium]
MLKVMGCRHYSAKDDIVRYGDRGDSFFVILRGSVDVKIPNSFFSNQSETSLQPLGQADVSLKHSSTDFGFGDAVEEEGDDFALMRKVDVVK